MSVVTIAALTSHDFIGEITSNERNIQSVDEEEQNRMIAEDKRAEQETMDAFLVMQQNKLQQQGESEYNQTPVVSPSIGNTGRDHDVVVLIKPNQIFPVSNSCSESPCPSSSSSATFSLANKWKSGLFLLNPESKVKMRWDVLIFLVVLYNAIKIPMTFAFGEMITAWTNWKPLDALCDILFAIDIVIKFDTTYRENGILVSDAYAVMLSYLKTWFLYDVFCVFPFDMIFGEPYRATRMARIILWFRYFKAWEANAVIGRAVLRLIKLVFFLLLSVHWVACMFNIVLNEEGPEVAQDWLPATPMEKMAQSFVYRYSGAVYWGFCVITGYGAFSPHTPLEFALTFCCNILGAFLYGFTFSNLVSIMAHYEHSDAMFREKLNALKLEINRMHLPQHLKQRIIDHFIYQHARQPNQNSMLSEIPAYLRTEITAIRYKDIKSVPIFAECDMGVIDSISLYLKPQVCLPNEYLIRKGQVGREMFFLTAGTVDVVSEDGEAIYKTLSEGAFFGEMALLLPEAKRTASVRAKTYCDLWSLSRSDFNKVLREIPEVKQAMLEIAVERDMMNKQQAIRASPSRRKTEKKTYKPGDILRKSQQGNMEASRKLQISPKTRGLFEVSSQENDSTRMDEHDSVVNRESVASCSEDQFIVRRSQVSDSEDGQNSSTRRGSEMDISRRHSIDSSNSETPHSISQEIPYQLRGQKPLGPPRHIRKMSEKLGHGLDGSELFSTASPRDQSLEFRPLLHQSTIGSPIVPTTIGSTPSSEDRRGGLLLSQNAVSPPTLVVLPSLINQQ